MDTGYANNNCSKSNGIHYSNYSYNNDWWGLGNAITYPPPAHNNLQPSRTTFVAQTNVITPLNFLENKKHEPEKPKNVSPEKKQHFGFFHRVKKKINSALNLGDCFAEGKKLKR